MPIIDSINEAKNRGASSDQILEMIIKKNPDKSETLQQARERGAGSDAILGEIIKQNTGKTQQVAPKEEVAKESLLGKFQKKALGIATGASKFATSVVGEAFPSLQEAGREIAGMMSQEEQTAIQKNQEFLGNQVLERIKDPKISDESKRRLIEAYSEINPDIISQNPELNRTVEQKFGSALRTAATPATFLAGGAISKAFGVAGASGFLSGGWQGFKAGATTGAFGSGLTGLGIGMQKDLDTGGVLLYGAGGMSIGALIGGPLGFITGGISGSMQASKMAKENFVKELVRPKMTPTEEAKAITQGRYKDYSFFEKAKLYFSKRDESVANAVKDVVSKKATLGQNIDAIRLKITRTNSGAKEYIQEHNVPLNEQYFKAQLNAGQDDLQLLFTADETAENLYDQVRDRFIRHMEGKTVMDLFRARQEFYKIPAVQKLLSSENFTENARREVVKAISHSANDTIAFYLPKGNPYKELMLQEHLMIEAIENIGEVNRHLIGKNGMQILSEQFPILNWLGGVGKAAIGAGIAGGGYLGFKALTGSSKQY